MAFTILRAVYLPVFPPTQLELILMFSRKKKDRPRNTLIFGEHGAGKSTLAAQFPNPGVIDIEGGCDDIDVATTKRIISYEQYEEAVNFLIGGPDVEDATAIVDTIDWLEKLKQAQVARRAGKSSIEEIGFGKGFKLVAEEFEQGFVTGIRCLNAKGYRVVLLGHAKCVKHSPPGEPAFDRWEPDLHQLVISTILEFCDEVFFLKQESIDKTEDGSFGKTRNLHVNFARRVLVCSNTGAVVAKNRLGIVGEIEATWAAYRDAIIAAKSRLPVIETPIGNNAEHTPEPQQYATEAGRELAEEFPA